MGSVLIAYRVFPEEDLEIVCYEILPSDVEALEATLQMMGFFGVAKRYLLEGEICVKVVKLSFKKCNIFVLACIILVGIFIIYYASGIQVRHKTMYVAGPSFYPILVASLLILFSIISIVSTLRKPDEIIELPNLGKAFFGLACLVAWIICWERYGYFYLFSFIFCGILMYFLNPKPFSRHKLLVSTLLPDIVIVASVYIMFDICMKTYM